MMMNLKDVISELVNVANADPVSEIGSIDPIINIFSGIRIGLSILDDSISNRTILKIYNPDSMKMVGIAYQCATNDPVLMCFTNGGTGSLLIHDDDVANVELDLPDWRIGCYNGKLASFTLKQQHRINDIPVFYRGVSVKLFKTESNEAYSEFNADSEIVKYAYYDNGFVTETRSRNIKEVFHRNEYGQCIHYEEFIDRRKVFQSFSTYDEDGNRVEWFGFGTPTIPVDKK